MLVHLKFIQLYYFRVPNISYVVQFYETISSVALEQSVLRKLLKAKRTEMSVKCLSVFSKFTLFFEMFRN